ncbi:hypothetical protein H9Q73_004590 [Fusarium xylarioides]|nr:hypothetical protein H9Q73_004590 [Fusarium xylarioides]
MSETRDPDHALPAAYLLYKTRACDNENRPLNELWNERFREEFSKWGHLQSESEKTEWRGRPNEEQGDAAITGQPETNKGLTNERQADAAITG